MSKKKIVLSLIIFVALLIVFVLPVRCTPFVVYPAHKFESTTNDIGSVEIPASYQRICTSIYRKEFWINTEILHYKIEVIWGPIWNTLNKASNYEQFSGDVEEVTIHPLYPADFSNNQILMGASHNVFVGKVLAQVGTNDFMGDPATQFSVQIIDNIKGELKDTVIINQSGGYKDGVLYVMDEGGALLQPGATYLLATRYDTDAHYYTLNPHENASKLLSTDSTLSSAALRTLIAKDPKVRALQAAYPNEELLQADVYHANTRNNFKSLSADMKAPAQSRADAAKASLAAGANVQ